MLENTLVLAAWYTWMIPLWKVGAGAIAVAAVLYGVYFLLVLTVPKVAAIAQTTAKEAWYQPLFWVELMLGAALLLLFPFLPYNTFGEDVKVIKDSGLTLILVLSILLAVWTASVSIAEEIEGRTALTLLAKPVGRRQFIIGKFLGVMAPVASMFILLGAIFLGTISYKVKHESRETSTPEPTAAECEAEMVQIVPAIALAFLETAVMAAIAVAISTRLPMLPNLLICATIYVLGHLVPLLANSPAGQQSRLVAFFGQLVAVVFPVLDNYTVQAAVATGEAIPWVYVAWMGLYTVLYCGVALLVALLLFEGRDLG
jgi:ABC-type transport system involved in multi-copper enzyme maturation permease subunit